MTDEKEPYAGEFMDAPHMAPEAIAARKKRNVWLGLALFGFVVLVAVTTIIRLSNTDLSEGAGFYYSNSDSRTPVGEAPALPPGMSEEQAAPPAGLEPDEVPE
jgi:hypothetical protein